MAGTAKDLATDWKGTILHLIEAIGALILSSVCLKAPFPSDGFSSSKPAFPSSKPSFPFSTSLAEAAALFLHHSI